MLAKVLVPRVIPTACQTHVAAHRAYGSHVTARRRAEEVHVRCGSNGHVKLKIYEPLVAPDSQSPLIIWLPPGPLHPPLHLYTSPPPELLGNLVATVVEIQYRLGQQYSYPTPVHDVLFGYDWILDNLVSHRKVSQSGRSANQAVRMGVAGELVGGSLAAMLALTECRAGLPHIAAAALNEPIVDWVSLTPTDRRTRENNASLSVEPSARSSKALTTLTLLEARRAFFAKEETYFDPFASPTLFLRTAGATVPRAASDDAFDEFTQLAEIEKEDFYHQQLRLASMSGSMTCAASPASPSYEGIPRKASRRYPPVGSGLRLPNFRISYGRSSALSKQATEFGTLLRKSVARSQDLDIREDHSTLAHEIASESVQMEQKPEVALWSTGEDRGILDVVKWFRDVL